MSFSKSVKYLTSREFDSPDREGSGEKMREDFVLKLDSIRKRMKEPMRITSGYRTASHNKKVGGKATSSHLGGWAADVAVASSSYRMRLIDEALWHGISRIGIGQNFVHLDIDPEKPGKVMWVYK